MREKEILEKEIIVSPFVHIFDIVSLFAAESEESKIGISGEELKCLYHHNSDKSRATIPPCLLGKQPDLKKP